MTCEVVRTPNGGAAIVCGPRRRAKRCTCGRPATLQCDARLRGTNGRTCDADLCAACTTSPAPGKDLCPPHARAFEQWKEARVQ